MEITRRPVRQPVNCFNVQHKTLIQMSQHCHFCPSKSSEYFPLNLTTNLNWTLIKTFTTDIKPFLNSQIKNSLLSNNSLKSNLLKYSKTLNLWLGILIFKPHVQFVKKPLFNFHLSFIFQPYVVSFVYRALSFVCWSKLYSTRISKRELSLTRQRRASPTS